MTINRLLNPMKALRTLRKTPALLHALLRDTTQGQSSTLRDGPDGWSVLFIACHLRDFEAIYRARIEQMLAEDAPTFTLVAENDEQAERNAYAAQDLRAVLADTHAQRQSLIARLSALSDEQWLRVGQHPEQGQTTVLDAAINAGLHDIDHAEQILRCLAR
ncbi:MAG: DinB family protein [Chloroflexales bacterium]|nr:DinB family protein [Chloroflexales bacterium]